MKKILLVIFLLSTAFAGKGQNLVPNGDFEQYYSCPSSSGQLDSALFWINPTTTAFPYGGTPDYFNQCAQPIVNVPTNALGFQNAHSGNAYCGILAGRVHPTVSNWREYAQVHLTSPLVPGTCYYFEMYMSLANTCQYTSEEMGVYFSDTLIKGNYGFNPLPFTPQLNLNLGFFTDTLNWVKVYGNYTPATAINYLLIGNFNDSLNTTMHLINQNAQLDYSYFYIDDVSLTPCTGIEEQNQNSSITIYPNPVKDELNIKTNSLTGKAEIKIYDVIGKEIYRTTSLTSDFRLPTSAFQKGIYFIEINTGKEIFRKKFLKE